MCGLDDVRKKISFETTPLKEV